MPDSTEREKAEATAPSAIARAAKDPVSRRKFMALTGGSAAAAAFLAACGSDSDSATTTSSAKPSGGERNRPVRQGRRRHPQLRAHARVPGDRLLRRRRQERALQGRRPGDDQEVRRGGGRTRRSADRGGQADGRQAGAGTENRIPPGQRQVGAGTGGTVENLGAAAYLGQAANIESPEVLASALAIHSVEGRHAAALNTLLGKSITPDGAFAKPADAKTVLKSVEPFIVG